MGLFGRKRGPMSALDEVKVLRHVADAQKTASHPFSVRTAVADALKQRGFDDKGIECPQELKLTESIGLACGIGQGQHARVEQYCKSKTPQELGRILEDAVRYAI